MNINYLCLKHFAEIKLVIRTNIRSNKLQIYELSETINI